MRRGLEWMVVVPIALAGMESAHAIANGLCGSPEGSGELFAAASSGAAVLVPVVALAVAVMLVGLLTRTAGAWGGSVGRRERALPFGLLPLLAFVVLEAGEGVAHHGGLPWGEFADSAFVVGLGLQLPFAAAGYLLARLLLRATDVVRQLVAGRARRPRVRATTLVLWRPVRDLPRSAPRRSARRGRAPPPLIASG